MKPGIQSLLKKKIQRLDGACLISQGRELHKLDASMEKGLLICFHLRK